MTLPNPISQGERAKQFVKRTSGAPYTADLIADDGQFVVQNNIGYVWVREILSHEQASGVPVYGKAHQVRSLGTFPVSYGQPVRVEYDAEDDEWGIVRADFNEMVRRDINPVIANALNPYTQFLDLSSLPPLRTFAVSNGNTATTEVAVKNFFYIGTDGTLQTFSLDPANRPDIGDNIPGAGLKRLVHLWLTSTNTIDVSVSTPINSALPFDITVDLAECINNPPDTLSIPIGAWQIENGQTAINEADLIYDTRPWLNTTPAGGVLGFPNPVTQTTIIQSGRTVTHAGDLVISTGDLIIQGDLIQLDGNIATRDVRRVTADYSIVSGDYTIFANTDSVPVTVTLPSGTQDRPVRIVNTGTSSKDVTIAPTGSDKIFGINSNWTLYDSDALILQYETSDGWY